MIFSRLYMRASYCKLEKMNLENSSNTFAIFFQILTNQCPFFKFSARFCADHSDEDSGTCRWNIDAGVGAFDRLGAKLLKNNVVVRCWHVA